MENLSSYDNDSLVKKFNDLKKVFQENIDNKTLRDNLNVQLGELVTELQKRNIDV
jgi:hypothetical protein